MNNKAEYPDMKHFANDITTAGGKKDTLRNYDIYYISPWLGIHSSRVLLIRKRDLFRTGVMEFIFSHAWRG